MTAISGPPLVPLVRRTAGFGAIEPFTRGRSSAYSCPLRDLAGDFGNPPSWVVRYCVSGVDCGRARLSSDNGSPPLNPNGTLTPTANSGKRKIDCHERGCYPRFSSREREDGGGTGRAAAGGDPVRRCRRL